MAIIDKEKSYFEKVVLKTLWPNVGEQVEDLIRLTSDQTYKHFMLVNYDSRVVPDMKIPHITTLES